MKKFECIIKVTSDWSDIEFDNVELTNVETTVIEGKASNIKVERNRISIIVERCGMSYSLKFKLCCMIRKNSVIKNVIIEKGDIGDVDVEVDGKHYQNTYNIPYNSRNKIIIKMDKSNDEGGNEKEVEKEIEIKNNEVEIKKDTIPILDVEKKLEIVEEKMRKEIVDFPRILIVTPTKNDAHYLQRHFDTWEQMDYPRDKIRWVWIYGESNDNTMEILNKYFSEGKWNCEVYSEPKFRNLTPDSAMWIADVMNSFKVLYRGENFVVLDDSDIVKITPSLLKELVSLDLDIVAPYVWHDGRKDDFFDTYVFRDLDGRKYPHKNVPYVDSEKPIELQSVGTMLLIKGKIFAEIDFANPCPTLQFCKRARKNGYRIWAAPWIKIFHADVSKEKGESHFPPDYYVEKGILPKSILEKVE